MTREEAITVLKGLSNNPLFSDLHKVAFNIAIHDIKVHHYWDINNLILINKDNYEPLEQAPVLDKIRAEIEKDAFTDVNNSKFIFVNRVNQILDKYKTESEETDG